MKYLSLIITTLFAVGCTSLAHGHDPEEMADLASQLKDISAAVDGTLKFSAEDFPDSQALLLAALDNDTSRLVPFQHYKLTIAVQNDNAVLLLCEDDVALIEDAGCTAKSDMQHWQAAEAKSCEFTLDTEHICRN
ncbi:hypothetical protein [Pseudoalteromonas sp. T1lg48]|uniref:hypothetical protein n=1 Tax=Pseudoalteromonas sp. T1lg48 TaxID=2077100 RepID=UPI000CF654F2|nr:hypothetical protein [Pseudoalteromonas sp. T1lg48]